MSDSLLEELIAAHLVLPNRVTVPVKKGLDVTNLLFPLPCVSTSTSHGAWGLGLTDAWACRGNAFSDDNCLCPVRAWLPYSIGGRLNLEKVDWFAQSHPSRERQSPGGIPSWILVPAAAWVGDCG